MRDNTIYIICTHKTYIADNIRNIHLLTPESTVDMTYTLTTHIRDNALHMIYTHAMQLT